MLRYASQSLTSSYRVEGHLHMKLPDTLTIGHQAYDIVSKDIEWMGEANRFGHCDFINTTIAVVNEGMSVNHIVNTLLHESFHALWRENTPPQL